MDRRDYTAVVARVKASVDLGLIHKHRCCESCGATPTQAHHDDYGKPLDVRWLCRRCHGKADAARRRLAKIGA